MKKIEVVISPNAADHVIELLEEHSVSTFTVGSILDRDSSGNRPRMYRGRSYTAAMVSKIKVEAVVADNQASEIAHAIMEAARGPGCPYEPRAIIVPVGEVITESSPKAPRPSIHRRSHPGPAMQRAVVAADAPLTGPPSPSVPLHLAQRMTSLLRALLGTSATDSNPQATPKRPRRSVARVTALGPPGQLGLRPR
jgi:nitrogen regulatory protein PII